MNGEHPIIALVRDLILFLSTDRLAIEDISARVGPVSHDSGGLAPIELRPALPGVTGARLARYPHSDAPYVLELDLASNARPTAAALTKLIGPYHRSRTDFDQPPEVIFYPGNEDRRWQVVVIAQLESALGDIEAAEITRLAFRRDPVDGAGR